MKKIILIIILISGNSIAMQRPQIVSTQNINMKLINTIRLRARYRDHDAFLADVEKSS